ncbi:MAG: biofilm protein TabA [Sulfurimonas sp.]|jgi:biofilm protein TabA
MKMAVFGKLDLLKEQVSDAKFHKAFAYLEQVFDVSSQKNANILSLVMDTCNKIEIDANCFALEQVYLSKERGECFFESHKKYIDFQFIVDGEEIIEVAHIDDLDVAVSYNEIIDFIKYEDKKENSSIILRKGELAIFYPEDSHMPCINTEESSKVVKVVIKVKV